MEIASAPPIAGPAAADDVPGSIWSASGALLRPDQSSISPDGRFTATWGEDSIMRLGGAMEAPLPEISLGPFPELLWSPGSRRLAVTWSDGGAVGGWNITVYDLTGGRPRVIDIAPLLDEPRRRLPVCHEAEIANAGAIAWLEGGTMLLLAVESPPHSSCTNMGDVLGLRVSLEDQRLLEEISQASLLRDWRAHLGPEVLGAEDP